MERATLPEKSILITIDDAYTSDYTRIYPLLLATKMPAVIAVASCVGRTVAGVLKARRC